MSNFSNGRRAPNVSQYLANLNTVPSAQDVSAQDFSLPDDGLDFLTNAEFFDFDNFNVTTDFAPQEQKPVLNNQQYQFGEFQTYPPASTVGPSPGTASPPNGVHGAYPPQQSQLPDYNTGDKRKASESVMASPVELDDGSRVAAEEDKRRRNTAASARFRVKKKQREQALEKSAKEMTDKLQSLENKVQQLEMENKWLKNLITEKGGVSSLPTFQTPTAEKKDDERSTSNRTDGVGTA